MNDCHNLVNADEIRDEMEVGKNRKKSEEKINIKITNFKNKKKE